MNLGMRSGSVVMAFLMILQATPDADAEPSGLAHVIIEGAVIGPGKHGGAKWDGNGRIQAADVKAFTSEASKLAQLTGEPYTMAGAAVVDILAGIAAKSATTTDLPDPRGNAFIYVNGKQRGPALSLPIVANTYVPHWQKTSWKHVPLNEDVRIRLELFDSDDSKKPGNDDQLGAIVVNSADLNRAAETGRVLDVYVGDQSNNQIVALKLTVMLEAYGTADASPPDVDARDADEVEAIVKFVDQLADIVATSRGDCKKIAPGVNALIDVNREVVARANTANDEDLPASARERMAARLKEMTPTMAKCGQDPEVQRAFARLGHP